MDPRLWEILNTPPGDLFIKQIALSDAGKSLTLECEAFSDSCPNGKRFRLIFSNCRDVRWQASDPNAGDEVTQALGMYLGERLHSKPAVVYTGGTEMSILYNDIYIDE